MVYIQQHLGIEMNILNDAGAEGMSTRSMEKLYTKRGYTISEEELKSKIKEIAVFPSDNCVNYVEDILIFRLGN